ncbi:hypothetical protein ABGB17_01290 [Sphaerisporangium sp. B11E5]|uniref:hypothetical protein n=1 Tax=Sphaerisporangium sp. B11E5 TaxID=3153563 RepID=UPI00325DF4A5
MTGPRPGSGPGGAPTHSNGPGGSGGPGPLRRVAARYGAAPWHAVLMCACFAVTAYVLSRVVAAGIIAGFALWFAGAVILHDLVLLPLYSLADRTLTGRLPRRPSVVNHVRVPAALSGLLLLVWFPLVLGASSRGYREAAALGTGPYLGRWILVTLALFAGSALVYVLRRVSGRPPRH